MTKVMSDILRLGNFQISNQDVNIQSRQRQIREKSWSRPKIQRLFKNYIAIQAFIRLFSGHGPQTGRCVLNDKPQRYGSAFVCQIQSWWVHYNSLTKWFTQKSIEPSTSRCPVEDDRLVLGKTKPLITGSETHTVFIKVKMLDQTRPDWWTRCVFQNSILFVQF